MKKKCIIAGLAIGIATLVGGGVYIARKGAMNAVGDRLNELTEQVRELATSVKTRLKK